MKSIKLLAAAAFAIPAAAMAQTVYVEKPAYVAPSDTYYAERVTVYDSAQHAAFVQREHGAVHSGGTSLDDAILADNVAMALARDRKLAGTTATVSANNGRVSVSGFGDQEQSERALRVAQRVAGFRNVSGAFSSDGG